MIRFLQGLGTLFLEKFGVIAGKFANGKDESFHGA